MNPCTAGSLVRSFTAIALAMLMLFACIAPTVSADDASISVDDVTLTGESRTVPIRLKGFTALGAMTITLGWDASLVQVALSNGTLHGGAILGNPSVGNPVAISCFSAAGFTGDAVLAYVTLTPLRPGQGTLDLDVSICVDIDATPIAPHIVDGHMSVLQAVSGTGDLPTDGEPHEVDSTQPTPPGEQGSTPGGTAQPSTLTASGLTIVPTRAAANEEATISANICNSGEERGTRTVSLMVNGQAVASQSVGVSGGACQQVTFKVSRAVPGTYQVAVDGMVGQFSVLAPGTVTRDVPSQQQTGLGTAGIIAIIVVLLVLIAALILVFRRD